MRRERSSEVLVSMTSWNEVNIMRRAAFFESATGVMVSNSRLPCFFTSRSVSLEMSLAPPLRMLSKTVWKEANCAFFWLLVLCLRPPATMVNWLPSISSWSLPSVMVMLTCAGCFMVSVPLAVSSFARAALWVVLVAVAVTLVLFL